MVMESIVCTKAEVVIMTRRGQVTGQDYTQVLVLIKGLLMPQSVGQLNQDYAIYSCNQHTNETGTSTS